MYMYFPGHFSVAQDAANSDNPKHSIRMPLIINVEYCGA